MDVATMLEILSPLFPAGSFLFVASLANVGKNISFLSASASRASLHQSLALRNNLADVTVKAGSQAIAASIVGTSLGCCISPLMGDVSNLLPCFFLLSAVHQVTNYLSLKAVSLKSLNMRRAHHVLDTAVIDGGTDIHVLSPVEVAQLESFLPFTDHPNRNWLKISSSLQHFCPDASAFDRLRSDVGCEEKYLINIIATNNDVTNSKSEGTSMAQEKTKEIRIIFTEEARGEDLLRGLFHCYHLVDQTIQKNVDDIACIHHLIQQSKPKKELANRLINQMQSKGWQTDIDNVLIELDEPGSYRLRIIDK